MDYINGINIKGLINEIKHAIILQDKIRMDFISNPDKDDAINNAMIKTVEQHINGLHSTIKKLITLKANTYYNKMYVDAMALKEALETYGNPIDSVEWYPMWNDPNAESNYPDIPPDYFQMRLHYSRYAMDGNGFHIGYENVTFITNAIRKKDLKLYGIPYNLSEYVIDPESFEIESKDLPSNEFPNESNHESNCEVFQRSLLHPWNPKDEPFPDDCTCECNDNWNGYYQPEDDFFETELDCLINSILQSELPEAEFNPETSEWSIGDQVTWKVGDPPNDDWIV